MTDTMSAPRAETQHAQHPQHGSFIWYELLTTDPDAAADFYGKVIGWKSRDAGMGGDMAYTLLSANGVDIGGLMKLPDAGMKPGWLGYIGVDDVDAAAEEIEKAGGSIHVPPTDIPNVGRFAMVADPQGAVFYVMRGKSDQKSEAFRMDAEGHAMWNELATGDPNGAFEFYAKLFAWKKGDAMPMGEAGDYQFLTHGGDTFGALMQQPPSRPSPSWTFCFSVSDIDAARDRVSANGGTPTEEPVEVPGGIWVFEALDPQGARFYLGGPRKS